MKKSYSSVEEYLKDLQYLEIREFSCPLCESTHIEIIYSRRNPTFIDCKNCKNFFIWEWKPERLFSTNRETEYPLNHYTLIDDLFLDTE